MLDHSVIHRTREIAIARRREAESQLRLLLNQDDDDVATDFYSYRYLASEGLLPGYSFPRLPLRAYVPGRRGVARDAEFLHRPRFIAITEFGPGSLIYHEGLRYQVNQVQLPPGDPAGHGGLDVQAARRCGACGYLHDEGDNTCRSCDASLTRTMYRLLRLQTVKAARRDRISSDEEERRRSGYQLVTSYRFGDDGARSRIRATVRSPAGPVAELSYGDSPTVRVTNLGLRRRRADPRHASDGYWIDTRSGRWLSERQAEELTSEDDLDDAAGVAAKQRVIPYVEDVRNILVARLATGAVDEATAVSVMYALERGIEAEFQLEDSELSAELLPDDEDRGRALFVESAEGGAGVLRRLVEETGALARAASRALEICHFDRLTGEDTGGVVDRTDERCAKACYDCLLSYANQGHHLHIDRHAAREVLLALARSTEVDRSGRVPDEGWEEVTLATEADPPRSAFLTWLAEHDHRCPDVVAAAPAGLGAHPDLVYDLPTGPVAVFVDGPDDADAEGRDARAVDVLQDAGWNVIRVPHGADYATVVDRYPSVFGRGRAR